MPKKCCVPNCDSHSYSFDKVAFFQFPSDLKRRQEWLRLVKREDPNVKRSTVVCSKHFEDKYLIKDHQAKNSAGQLLTLPRERILLRNDAVPSILLEEQLPWTPPDTNTTLNDSDLEIFDSENTSSIEKTVAMGLLQDENNLFEKCLEMGGDPLASYLESSGLSLDPLSQLEPVLPQYKRRKEQANLTTLPALSVKSGGDEDEFDLFGRSVASQLKNMPLGKALRLQLRIQALIIEDRLSVDPPHQ